MAEMKDPGSKMFIIQCSSMFSSAHCSFTVFPVSIAPAVRVPEAVTPQQAASGQTAIMYPSAHAHALGQMVRTSS